MNKKLEQVKKTPELMLFYKQVGEFLKKHPEIQSRKLSLGYQVNIGTIPKHLVDEWIEVSTFELWQKKNHLAYP